MKFDVAMLSKKLSSVKEQPTVPTHEVNAYLLEKLVLPLRRGETLRYGQIDFSAFDIDDIRTAAGYSEECDRVSWKLESFAEAVIWADAMPCQTRAFC